MAPDDAAARRLRKKFADLQPEPLFDMEQAPSGEPQNRTAKPRTIRTMICKRCRQEVKVIAKGTRTGPVLIIREHYRRTRKGHSFLCPMSGTELTR